MGSPLGGSQGVAMTRTLAEVRSAPVLTLTEDEINLLDSETQNWARRVQARHTREAACTTHERVSTSSYAESNRGDHRGECKHCGKNMDQDSGD